MFRLKNISYHYQVFKRKNSSWNTIWDYCVPSLILNVIFFSFRALIIWTYLRSWVLQVIFETIFDNFMLIYYQIIGSDVYHGLFFISAIELDYNWLLERVWLAETTIESASIWKLVGKWQIAVKLLYLHFAC